MSLRPYQESAVDTALESLRANGHTILAAPTGSGKTTIGAEIVSRIGRKTLWVAHRRELIDQAHERLLREGLDCGVILAGRHSTPSAQVQVASVQTLARRDLPEGIGLVVIDECHHAVPSGSYASLFLLGAPVLGLTATPFRLDGKGLGEVGFKRIVPAATVQQLCDEGFLMEPTVYAPSAPDMSGVHTIAGDFNLAEASEVMSGSRIVGNVIETWLQRAKGRKTVCFAVDIQHSRSLCARFVEAGVRAAHLDGSTPNDERSLLLKKLRDHEIDVLCNCMILAEGWDLPALEVAVVTRPTKSLNLHLQMLGRIMRAAEGKNGALVLDHAGNYDRLGLVTDPIVYSLTSRPEKAPTNSKKCPMCGCVCDLDEERCPDCGHDFYAPKERGEVIEVAGTLEAVKSGSIAVPFVERAAAWRRFLHHARHRGNDNIAYARYKDTFGEYPLVVDDALLDPAAVTEEQFVALRVRWRSVGEKKGWTPAKTEWFAKKCETDVRRVQQKVAVTEHPIVAAARDMGIRPTSDKPKCDRCGATTEPESMGHTPVRFDALARVYRCAPCWQYAYGGTESVIV